MTLRGIPLWTRVLALGLMTVAVVGGDLPGGALSASRQNGGSGARSPNGNRDPWSLLGMARPDFRSYIDSIRLLPDNHAVTAARRPIYMALVRPGADDPTRTDNAPFAGPGVRNDIVYRRASLDDSRSLGWTMLLLDHEYFHARHLAGATSLPLPGDEPAASERHFFEAAAWGFNVAEARQGRYHGLREDEFREALDRYGEHYRGLRAVTRHADPALWQSFSDLLSAPAELVRTAG
ncbi:MAG TPA: hypothetical protein VFG08_04490 [Candidatus Polarisedimenticolia bacterium]|nr:hypothetical protein [Candidatus Polarisedimenticolia bacterium]